jgi:histidinol-phosphate aminotransferase
MDANESPYQLPAGLKDKISKKVADFNFNRYPDSDASYLRKKLANYTYLKPDNIIVGNGSDELLSLLMTEFLDLQKKALISVPTFGMYQFYANTYGQGTIEIRLGEDFSLNWSKLSLQARREDVGIIVICSPNNPTGNPIDYVRLEELLEETNKPVLLDEAYFEFYGKTKIDLVKKYKNLIVTRTFSKAFGIAGLRIGYLAADYSLIDRLNKIRSLYNADSFSQKIASLVLDSIDLFEPQWQRIKENRSLVYNKLKSIEGVTPYPSSANFLMFNTKQSEKGVYERLQDKGIKIRYLPDLPLCGDTLRVTIGNEKEICLFLKFLTQEIKCF